MTDRDPVISGAEATVQARGPRSKSVIRAKTQGHDLALQTGVTLLSPRATQFSCLIRTSPEAHSLVAPARGQQECCRDRKAWPPEVHEEAAR